MNRMPVLTLVLAVILLLAACSGGQEAAPAVDNSDQTNQAMAEEMVSDEMDSGAMDSEAMDSEEMVSEDETGSDHPDEMMDGEMAADSEEMTGESDGMAAGAEHPTWQTLPLTNARTGETFALADFAGKTVYVEPMATWCTNCRRQLGNVKDAYSQLAGEDVVFVALSVETNIGDGDLANYANDAGFDWLFAVLSPEMLQELANEFGQTIANPPATPHLVIRPDGSVSSLLTGIDSAEDIISQIRVAQG